MNHFLIIFFLFCFVICSYSVFTVNFIKRSQRNIRANATDNENLTESTLNNENNYLPIVINTWDFIEAGEEAWKILHEGGSALDAVEKGCTVCEELQCDGTVGYGGSPDENGETTLDAMIMDGETHDVGAVGALRKVKNAISVARSVMEHTQHTLLVGSQATDFALMMGFSEVNLSTTKSEVMHNAWEKNNCQPNFWKNVKPNPKTSCGPYTPAPSKSNIHLSHFTDSKGIGKHNHDTIGMIAIDSQGKIAGGTSTNGARFKIPGRVGDSPIPGSGAYVDKNIGGSAATGDGDLMMRFMPSLLAVEGMRAGMSPNAASSTALQRIAEYYPLFSGAIVSVNLEGQFGAACHNLPEGHFNFTVGYPGEGAHLESVPCLDLNVIEEIHILE